MINWVAVLVMSLLMMWSVSADIKEHRNRRSQWWILFAFLLSLFGAVAYLIYDRVRK